MTELSIVDWVFGCVSWIFDKWCSFKGHDLPPESWSAQFLPLGSVFWPLSHQACSGDISWFYLWLCKASFRCFANKSLHTLFFGLWCKIKSANPCSLNDLLVLMLIFYPKWAKSEARPTLFWLFIFFRLVIIAGDGVIFKKTKKEQI